MWKKHLNQADCNSKKENIRRIRSQFYGVIVYCLKHDAHRRKITEKNLEGTKSLNEQVHR